MKNVLYLLLLVYASGIQAQSSPPSLDSLEPDWNTITTDGVCSSGTPFQFYVKDSPSSSDLLIFFNGGGACWFGQACDLTSQPNIHSPFADMPQNNPASMGGIFELDNPLNPMAEFDMVYLPYCTGDVHIGGGPQEYNYKNSDGQDVSVTAFHNGYANTMQVLDWSYKNFSAPERVVLAGSSAGAIGASFYAGLVAEHFGETPVVLLGDAAGGYGSPLLYRTHSAWQTAAILPNWPEYAGKTDMSLTFEDYYIASANHNPNLTIAQYNTANDQTQVMFTQVIGDPPGSFSLPERLLNNYVRIESEVDEFYSYTAGGAVHTILQDDIFYQYSVENVRFVDWLSALIAGDKPNDISCVREAAGCAAAPASGI
jgi:hypothetical protein